MSAGSALVLKSAAAYLGAKLDRLLDSMIDNVGVIILALALVAVVTIFGLNIDEVIEAIRAQPAE